MTAWFNDSTIRRLFVEGNVQLIMFPMENDSTYNKFAFVESSYLDGYFAGNSVESIHFWPETTSKITPLYLAKRGSYFLPKFQWLEEIRPFSKFDIFDVPEAMVKMIDAAEPLKPIVLKKIDIEAAKQSTPDGEMPGDGSGDAPKPRGRRPGGRDRKSTRLNSSHLA